MDGLGPVETNAEVLAVARAAGFEPSEKQRKDWRRVGLLPRHLDQKGKGRDRGSVVLYPAGTGELLVAICRHAKPKKPVGDMALLVWWDGYALPDPALVREALARKLDRWERLVAPWESPDGPTLEEWRKLERALPMGLSTIRAIIGAGPFRWFVGELARIAAGNFGGFRLYPGAGVADVRNDAVLALGLRAVTWLKSDLESALTDLSATVKPSALRVALDHAKPADLDRARDDAREVAALLDALAGLGKAGVGGDQLAPFALLDSPASTAFGVGMRTLFWLALSERPALRRALQSLTGGVNGPIVKKVPPRRLPPSRGCGTASGS